MVLDLFYSPNLICYSPAGDVPAGSVPQDGRALLHRQEQVQAGPCLQEEDYFLHGHHPGMSFATLPTNPDD